MKKEEVWLWNSWETAAFTGGLSFWGEGGVFERKREPTVEAERSGGREQGEEPQRASQQMTKERKVGSREGVVQVPRRGRVRQRLKCVRWI